MSSLEIAGSPFFVSDAFGVFSRHNTQKQKEKSIMRIVQGVHKSWSIFYVLSLIFGCSAFSGPSSRSQMVQRRTPSLQSYRGNSSDTVSPRLSNAIIHTLATTATAIAILTSPVTDMRANADEWGRETEAPTLFTGETVMICKKRGPLGACLETAVRTPDNDNDKSLEYFRDPSEEVKRKQEKMITSGYEDNEGNELIQRLRRQSEENREKNENSVRVKTMLNDQGASFGPFDRQVVILNTDGRTFTLLENPQAMRLKKAGYIGKDRKFIIQPSQEVIDAALEDKNDLGSMIKGFFGGSDDSKVEESVTVGSLEPEQVDVGVDEKDVSTGEEATSQ
ncbi:hypothetical protein HJC23_002476 [Cyclotella cryptica]|uniref:Uncharacterized protein n=1 Tax=Cyclotella cryptica TaxID=29204 RepID=A0ABD3PIF0_9STRA|eukprot:CCRYP_015376-RA/>CCRYP_015376-RA protein AED:0.01 eAED:0.01 QI:63/1/1/1/0.28/0.25/8/4732/335